MSTPHPPRTQADPADRPPRASATVVVLRDAPQGLEVLLLRRAERGDHNSGAWVFPGGLVDAHDADAGTCRGLDDAAASRRLGLARGGLAYFVAAVRECFEECGLLLACTADGRLVAPTGEAAQRLAAARRPLSRGEHTIAALCAAEGWQLAVDRLVYLSHWITPVGVPKRFDTRFFVAEAPAGQSASHDEDETVAQRWFRPDEALAPEAGLKLITPTLKTLQALRRFARVEDALAWARSLADIPATMPRIGVGAGGRGKRPVTPDEPAWAELGRLDPQGRGDACYEIQPGVPVRLSPRVIRVTANNGSQMTGPGTNTYLVGGGERNEWAVIDPGPEDDAHVRAILEAAPGAIRWILATHTHPDHSPACVALKAATGAPVHGRIADHPEWQDASFAPDVPLQGGERLVLTGCDATLQVVHTRGHASNHLCFLLDEEHTLFTGDHVMQLSTVVINPPDGDMAAYIASLRELQSLHTLQWLAPGHGFLMAEPLRVFEGIVQHRLKREAKVLAALPQEPAAEDVLLGRVYDDVPPRLHAMALRSLRAHLLKLRAEGRALQSDAGWCAVADVR